MEHIHENSQSRTDNPCLQHKIIHPVYAVCNDRPQKTGSDTQKRRRLLQPPQAVEPDSKHLVAVKVLVYKYFHILHFLTDHAGMFKFCPHQAHQRMVTLIHITRRMHQARKHPVHHTFTENTRCGKDAQRYDYYLLIYYHP